MPLEMLTDPLVWGPLAGAYGAGAVGSNLLARLAMKGTILEEARAAEKAKNTRLTNQLLANFRQEHQVSPDLSREREFNPAAAYAEPDKMEANVSYFSHPAVAAHELGHLSNELDDKGSILGKIRRGVTNFAYSPLSLIGPVLAAAGYMTDVPDELGMVGTGLTAGTVGAHLLEEGRASHKALKSLKQLRGKTEAQDVLPLAGGFGTYGLAGLSSIGLPLLGGHLMNQ